VHRDLKPTNVFVSADNPEWVRITDFGIALFTPLTRGATDLAWQAPEAADPAAAATPAADVYSLALVCFFALTGGSPFRALRRAPVDPTELWREVREPLGPLSMRAAEIGAPLAVALDAWFARALALHPAERFESAGQLASSFAQALATNAPAPPPTHEIPGIAAAIAQPLVFQPEPPPPQRAPAPAPATPLAPDGPLARASQAPKQLVARLLFGGAILCFALTALGGYLLYRYRSTRTEALAAPEASAAPPATTPSGDALATAEAPEASASAKPPGTSVTFECTPEACEWVVCDGKSVTLRHAVDLGTGAHQCSASRFGFGTKLVDLVLASGEEKHVVFELPALPPAAARRVEAAAGAQTSAKPATTPKVVPVPASTPVPAAPSKPTSTPAPRAAPARKAPKKNCGTFINPCK
jgi:eukaryotic-like serine/threonine-protein kinase